MPDNNIKNAWTELLGHIDDDLDDTDPKAIARMCFYSGAFCMVHLLVVHPFRLLSVWRELSKFRQEIGDISSAKEEER